ncbi:hypothetical protein C8Q70DRAFT_930394 [Cubamyces menziesii]|nr:hypothetical protein C8Q70DRAFT_930394 [Cubamyces menziesii]
MSGNTPSYAEQDSLTLYPPLDLLRIRYISVAASVLLWYDVILTLPTEYSRIWKRRFSGATLIYLIMRYSMVIDGIFTILKYFLWKSSEEYATVNYTTKQYGPEFGCLTMIGLADRVYSGADTSDSSMKRITLPVLIAQYVTTMVAYVILISCTCYKTIGIKKVAMQAGMHTPLTDLLLRDADANIVGLVRTLLLTLTALVTWNAVKTQLACLLTLVNPMTSIIISRFMLDLRTLYFSDDPDEPESIRLSTTGPFPARSSRSFMSSVVGNLGTTLRMRHNPPDSEDGDFDTATDSSFDRTGYDGADIADNWDDEPPRFCDDPFTAGSMQTVIATNRSAL